MNKVNMKEATVITVKCARTSKLYGMRMEKKDTKWVATWAFRLSEVTAKSEKYDKEKVSGELDMDDNYPGCPYCGSYGLIQCGSCGKLFDWDGKSQNISCVHCNTKINLENSGSDFSIEGESI